MSSTTHSKRRKGRDPSYYQYQPPVYRDEKDSPPKSFNSVVEVGAEFDSFDGLDNAIRVYEAEHFVNLIARDTRRIEAAEKRNRRKIYNPAIKYSDVCYCCTYGGKKYMSRSSGKRTHKSIKQACPFNLKVRATVDGQRLFIREMCATHNHEINEADFRLHPKQRKLDHVSQEEIAMLLSLEPDKRLLREKLMQVTGKVILMKDIHNIKTRLVNSKAKEQVTEEINDLSPATIQEEERNEQITVVELVENLTSETEHIACDFQEGKQEPMATNSLSIHIPVSQIAASELTSVLSTIVNANSEHTSSSLQGNQSQTVSADSVDVNTVVEFSHPSNIFPCSMDSFSHHTHEVYQVNGQPLISDVGSVVAPASSMMNLPDHSSIESRHQSFNPLEDVNNIGINVLNTLQQWQDIESHNPERTSFPTVNPQQLSPRNSSIITIHEPGPLVDASKLSSPFHQSLSPRALTNNINSSSLEQLQHFQQQQQQSQQLQHQRKSDSSKRKLRARPTCQPRKPRRNPIESDKEALKKKYFQQASVNLFFNERFSFAGNAQTRNKILTPGTTGNKKMATGTVGSYHEMLKPLCWLFGKWKGEQGKGYYPTIDDFSYAETAEFYPVMMKPMIEYKLYSTKPDGSIPLHRETGFIRIKPNSSHIAFIVSHNLGIAEVQEGEVKDGELTVETTNSVRVSFNKPPVVKKVRRTLKRIGDDLEQVMDMQTDATEMTEHLRITFKKADS